MDALIDAIFAALQAFLALIIDTVLTLVYWAVSVICLLLPEWHLPVFSADSSFYFYCQWVAYFIPVNYSISLWCVWLMFLLGVKTIRGTLSIVQVDV